MTAPHAPHDALLARLAALSTLDRAAIVDDERGETSHRQLASMALAAAARLRDGRPSLDGERVAILAQPGAAWVAAFFGVVLAGGVAVPLSPLHPHAELAYFVDDAGARRIIACQALADRARALPALCIDLHELVAPSPIPAAPAPPDPSGVALMLYTSGTTGRPKGAMITHENIAVQARLVAEAWRVTEADRLLHALPLHHMHGLVISLMTALLAGASARMLPRFEAHRFWTEMAHCSVVMAVPTMYHKLFEALDHEAPDLQARWQASARSLRLATSGSAALPVSLAERWRTLTGDIPVERFGMTEIGVGTTNPIDGPRKPGCVGLPLPTVELRVVGDDGRDVAPGHPGEIWVRGPSVFAGYHGRPEATEKAFRDGWFVSGDTAVVDGDGHVRILGRSSVDILKSGGYKLSALEIEEVLRQHPLVAEVAVVGVPDEAWGDRVVAVMVLKKGPGEAPDAQAFRAFCKEHLAPYKVPREFVVRPELPRNAVGKVVKPELVRSLAAGS